MSRQPGVKSTVRLARGGIGFLLASVVLLAAAIYTQNNLLFWSFGLMIGGFVVATLLSQFMLRNISVVRVLPQHVVAGEPAMVRYEVTSKQRLLPSFGVVIHEAWSSKAQFGVDKELPDQLSAQPACWLLHLGPGQTQHISAPICPNHRGKLTFQRIVVQTTFPFGIYARTVVIEHADEVLVYPPLYRLDRQLLAKLSTPDHQGRNSAGKPGGVEDFYGLREYRPGDSLRTVDWKRSASRSSMVSREHEMPQAPKVRVVLDLSHDTDGHVKLAPPEGDPLRLPESPAERAISLAASLICEAYLRGCEVGLTVRGVEAPAFRPHHSVPHRTQILDALCGLDLSARGDTSTSASLPGGQGLAIVISTDRSDGDRRDGVRALSALDMPQHVVSRENDIHQLLKATTRNGGGKNASQRRRRAAG